MHWKYSYANIFAGSGQSSLHTHLLPSTYVSLVSLILSPRQIEQRLLQPDIGLPKHLIETTGFIAEGLDDKSFMLQPKYDSSPSAPSFPVFRNIAQIGDAIEDGVKPEVPVSVVGALRKLGPLYIEAYQVLPLGKAS